MSEKTSGKLVIKSFVNHSAEDSKGRRSGRWVTLLTEHGLDKENAQLVARDFATNNPTFKEMQAEFLPYSQHIYI
jgi:hypothetical protein